MRIILLFTCTDLKSKFIVSYPVSLFFSIIKFKDLKFLFFGFLNDLFYEKQEHAQRNLILTTKYAEYFEKHIIKV